VRSPKVLAGKFFAQHKFSIVITLPALLVLLSALVISSFISRALPAALPRPLVQIAMGAALGLSPTLHIDLNPDVFFLLFVPPLLFFDGWRIPNKDLVEDRAVNLQLALGLVFLTVLIIGWFVHWLIPGVPLPVAFAFAAAVSPTDAISVVATVGTLPVARRTLRILTSESLLNDATGLVCLRFAVAATLTGAFSVSQVLLNFLWIAAAGIAVGLITALAIARACNWLAARVGEEPGVQVVISLLIPFLAYSIAETLHCSGILAAVCAGIAMSYVEAAGTGSANSRVQRTSVWETIHFSINGMVFIMLGEQLPKLMSAADQALYAVGERHLSWGIVYVLIICLALMIIRGIWLLVVLPREVLWPDGAASWRLRAWQQWAVMTVASPRGAVTLAGALTLPYSLPNGAPFPARDMVIVLAMGVILTSLIVAGLTLPLLLRDAQVSEPPDNEEENLARVFSAQAALNAIAQLERELKEAGEHNVTHGEALSMLQTLYAGVIESKSRSGWEAEQSRASENIERDLRVAAIKAERDAIFELLREERISSEVADKLIRELDLLQTHHDEK
jgi:CPA1 family monovalent cation:H+ antiporter